MTRPEISIVIPLLDEVENVDELLTRTLAALDDLGRPGEVICVDDGSRDGTFAALRRWTARDPRLTAVRLARHFGQAAALGAGVDRARGAVIVPMDGDLQNDPADIGALVATLEGGQYDVVSGWRRVRQDPLHRRVPSWLANRLISRLGGIALHDTGCTLKAYRATVARNLPLYGGTHRFLPLLAHWQGARITEQPVRHHPRRRGRSKYGLERTVAVLFDLVLLRTLAREEPRRRRHRVAAVVRGTEPRD